jgi:acetyl esterase/lipase
MRTAATTFISIFFYMSLNAQSPEKIELWPARVPGEEKPKSEARFTDNRDRNVTRIAEVTNPLLEVYRPATSNGAAVVICPGGGYNILAIDLEGYEVAEWLAGLGYTAFVLQYRVPQKQEGALQDVQRAIRLVRSQAGKYGIDADKIGVLGFSAGGSLAARASTRFNDKTYTAMDATDQLSARPEFSVLIYPAYLDQGENLTLTPELKISEETPPMYIFATADDKYANSSLVMTQALREHEIPVELHILPAGGHGYGLRKGSEAAEFWPERAEKWLLKWVGAGN